VWLRASTAYRNRAVGFACLLILLAALAVVYAVGWSAWG